MQEFAKFISLSKVSGNSQVVQGFKGGKRPNKPHRGSNGSFRVFDRTELNLTLEYKGHYYTKDIYYDVKDVTTRKLTDKFCSELENAFKSFKFTVENGRFTNIVEAIEYAVNS